MYDTLMQMGRWFGYRPNYLDLTRIYTTSELVDWFGHIADAATELREEFDQMALTGATPRQYGLKVQSHDVLLVTSQLKMHAAKSLLLSFSGRVVQTVALALSESSRQANLDALRRLALATSSLPLITSGHGIVAPDADMAMTLRSGVSHVFISDFLNSFVTHSAAYRVNGPLISEFIDRMADDGELITWSLVMAGKASADPYEILPGVTLGPVTRKGEKIGDRFSIGTLLDPKDELFGMSEAQWRAAQVETARRQQVKRKVDGVKDVEGDSPIPDMPSGAAARFIRGSGAQGVVAERERGLLIVYAIEVPDEPMSPLLGFVLSFPESTRAVKVEYKVNNVMWEADYATA